MKALRALGHPYTDEEIAQAPSMLEGKTGTEAPGGLLAGLGRALSTSASERRAMDINDLRSLVTVLSFLLHRYLRV